MEIVTFLKEQKIFTKRALSHLTGINESLLSQYVNGVKVPSEKQKQRISDALEEFGKELSNLKQN